MPKIIKLKRGLKTNVSKISAIADGEPLVALDSGELYIGNNNAARRIGDIEKIVTTKAELNASVGIDGKIYIVLSDESNNNSTTLYLFKNLQFNCLSSSLIMNDASDPNSSILWSSKKISDVITDDMRTNIIDKLGTVDGIATLDGNGLIPLVQLPNKGFIVTFNITSELILGVLPIPQKIMDNGTITSIDVIASTTGTTNAEIDIEKISEANLESGGNFATIFANGADIIIPANKYSNKSATVYQLADSNINKGDILRLNVKNTGNGFKGISLEIKVQLR